MLAFDSGHVISGIAGWAKPVSRFRTTSYSSHLGATFIDVGWASQKRAVGHLPEHNLGVRGSWCITVDACHAMHVVGLPDTNQSYLVYLLNLISRPPKTRGKLERIMSKCPKKSRPSGANEVLILPFLYISADFRIFISKSQTRKTRGKIGRG